MHGQYMPKNLLQKVSNDKWQTIIAYLANYPMILGQVNNDT